jgi:hypothetical protein
MRPLGHRQLIWGTKNRLDLAAVFVDTELLLDWCMEGRRNLDYQQLNPRIAISNAVTGIGGTMLAGTFGTSLPG